jgi:hypothetical protein
MALNTRVDYPIDRDATIWADNCAQRTTSTLVLRIKKNRWSVSLIIESFREFDDILGAGRLA